MIQTILFVIVAIWLLWTISKIVWGFVLILAGLFLCIVGTVVDIVAAIIKAFGRVWAFLRGR